VNEDEIKALAASAQADGEAAVAEATDREAQGWALNVRNAEGNAQVSEAHAALDMSRAGLRFSLTKTVDLFNGFLLLGLVGAVVLVITAAIKAIGNLL
jgi:hypothetical protein